VSRGWVGNNSSLGDHTRTQAQFITWIQFWNIKTNHTFIAEKSSDIKHFLFLRLPLWRWESREVRKFTREWKYQIVIMLEMVDLYIKSTFRKSKIFTTFSLSVAWKILRRSFWWSNYMAPLCIANVWVDHRKCKYILFIIYTLSLYSKSHLPLAPSALYGFCKTNFTENKVKIIRLSPQIPASHWSN
jgi:hypothetical protein